MFVEDFAFKNLFWKLAVNDKWSTQKSDHKGQVLPLMKKLENW